MRWLAEEVGCGGGGGDSGGGEVEMAEAAYILLPNVCRPLRCGCLASPKLTCSVCHQM